MNSYFPGLLMFSIQPTIHSYPLQPKVQPLRHKYPIYLLMSMFDLMNLCKNILLCICMFLIQSPLLPTPTLCLECPRYVFMSIFDFMNLCKNILLCICIFLIQSTPPTHPHPVSRVSQGNAEFLLFWPCSVFRIAPTGLSLYVNTQRPRQTSRMWKSGLLQFKT